MMRNAPIATRVFQGWRPNETLACGCILALTLMLTTALTGQEQSVSRPQPTAAELLPITEAVRDYYRASARKAAALDACAACKAFALEEQEARARAQALAAPLEAKYACKYALDTNVCTPQAKETN